MLKSCQYCGRVHESNYECEKKPKKVFKKYIRDEQTEQQQIRKRYKWMQKSQSVRERDNFMCQVCLRNIYHTLSQYNTDTVEVHHIEPLKENPSRAYDDYNLITLCKYHHEVCEKGMINRSILFEIAKEQVEKY